MSIGERIKIRRKELGLSVDALAEQLGKNRATIYRYENNEIENLPISIIEPLAEILNVDPSYLMGWEDDGELIASQRLDVIENFDGDIGKCVEFQQAEQEDAMWENANAEFKTQLTTNYGGLIKDSGKSKKWIAQNVLGIDEFTFNKYASGDKALAGDALVRLAKFFNCTTDYLLGITDEPNLVHYELPEDYKIDGQSVAIDIVKEALDKGLTEDDLKDIIDMALKLRGKK